MSNQTPLQNAFFCHVSVPQGSTGRYLHGASSVLGPPGGKGIATPAGMQMAKHQGWRPRGHGLFSKTTFFSPALIVFVLSYLRMTDLTIYHLDFDTSRVTTSSNSRKIAHTWKLLKEWTLTFEASLVQCIQASYDSCSCCWCKPCRLPLWSSSWCLPRCKVDVHHLMWLQNVCCANFHANRHWHWHPRVLPWRIRHCAAEQQ